MDPQGPETGEHHVLRGGSCHDGPVNARCAARITPTLSGRSTYGFRVVCMAPTHELDTEGEPEEKAKPEKDDDVEPTEKEEE